MRITRLIQDRPTSFILISMLIITLITGCDQKTNTESSHLKMHELKGQTMGTYYNVKYVIDPTTQSSSYDHALIQKAIDDKLLQINDEISTYIADSHLSKFNQSSSTEPVKIPMSLAQNILISQLVGQETGGSMDITVGPLVNLWGFGPDKVPEKIPTEDMIQQARAKTGLNHLVLISMNDGFYLQKLIPELYVDLSTVGEGYGADELGKLLRSFGITDYLISIGGTIHSLGVNDQGKNWRVAIEKPSDVEFEVQQAINLRGQSISTAGSYRNYFEKDGVRYSHVIDPTSGKPITHKLVSATVIAPTALEADAWDTGLMVLGRDRALEVAKRNGLAVYLITKTESGFEVDMTDNFKPFLSK